MIPIKIQCGCGQRYAFDAEPVHGRMPYTVACPICGVDGTEAANQALAQIRPVEIPAAPVPGRLALAGAPTVHRVISTPAGLRSAAVLPGQMDAAQAQHEARAQIFWGDAPQEVVKFLMRQGIAVPEASALVDELFQERAATIRRNGIRKVVIGIPLICVPIAAWFIFASARFIPMKLFALTIMAGLYGAWMALKGTIMFFAPKSEPGDVSTQ